MPCYSGKIAVPNLDTEWGADVPFAQDVFPWHEWPYLPALLRLILALGLGLFVGLERQRRGKEAGVRTFAFAGLIGFLGGLLGDNFALLSLGLVGLLVVFLTIHAVRANHGT